MFSEALVYRVRPRSSRTRGREVTRGLKVIRSLKTLANQADHKLLRGMGSHGRVKSQAAAVTEALQKVPFTVRQTRGGEANKGEDDPNPGGGRGLERTAGTVRDSGRGRVWSQWWLGGGASLLARAGLSRGGARRGTPPS